MKKIYQLSVILLLIIQSATAAEDYLIWEMSTQGKVFASPVIQNDTMYIGSTDGYFYALDAATGNQLWKYNTNNEVRTTAVLFAGVIIFESGNVLYGLNHQGEKIWTDTLYSGDVLNEHDEWDCFRSSPTLSDGVVYIGSEDGLVLGVNAITGNRVFGVQTPQANATIETTPLVYDNMIFVGDWLGVFSAFNISTQELAWQYDTKDDNTYEYWVNAIISKPLILNDTLYFGGRSCNLYALDPHDGQKHWMYHNPEDKWLFGGPIESEGVLYVGSSYQQMLYAFSPNKPELLWEVNVGGLNYGDPLIFEDYVVVGTGDVTSQSNGGSLKAVNKKDQTIVAKFDVDGWIETTPLLMGDNLYFGATDGKIYAIDFNSFVGKEQEPSTAIQKTRIHKTNLYPNPASDEVLVDFSLNKGRLIKITIMDISGKTSRIMHEGNYTPGNHTIYLSTRLLSKGMYICNLHADNEVIDSQKLSIL